MISRKVVASTVDYDFRTLFFSAMIQRAHPEMMKKFLQALYEYDNAKGR